MEVKKLLVKNAEELKDLDKQIKFIRDSDDQTHLHKRRNELVQVQNNLLKKLKG